MLQQDEPDDFVIATGEQRSVRDFVEAAAQRLGMRLQWQGSGLEERGVDARSGRTAVRIDPRYFRPAEVDTLLGDPAKARARLGWTPTTSFAALVDEMVQNDLQAARRDLLVQREGFKVQRYRE
jgi:GDPmannose 4,6-dehydratase